MNHLEQLIAEWYEYRGYFVRRNVRVGKRVKGGYECELDIVAFDPHTSKLVHIEPSSDTQTWATREARYKKKFDAGDKYIKDLFHGFKLPAKIEKQAIFLFGSKTRTTVGGGTVLLARDILKQIHNDLRTKNIEKAIVPESFPLLRTLHIYIDQYDKMIL